LRQKTPYLALSYYKPATATYTVTAKKDGKYHLVVDLTAKGNFASSGFDLNKASSRIET